MQSTATAVQVFGYPSEAALEITAETGRAGWDGFFPVDYADAVGWLLELGG